MNVQEMKNRKRELGYTYEQIAEKSGIPLGTVQKIFSGVTQSPRYDTLRALEKIFLEPDPEDGRERGESGHHAVKYDVSQHPGTEMVREPAAAYGMKKQGEYTLKDYYTLPDERRMELIDGVLYDMASPSMLHQLLSGQLFAKLFAYIQGRKGACVPMTAPADVCLDCDDQTMVQPDVFVVCDRSKLTGSRIEGAPDLIMEILSPATKKKDMFLKLQKYMNAGVREYWMIDPDKKTVIVYDFDNDNYPVIYGFEAKIPVAIFDGECVIDFGEIFEYIKFMYG